LGWTVEIVRTDNDTSAYSQRKPRPQYLALLDDVQSGRINAIVAWAGDRLHRSPRELEDFIDLLEKYGVAVQTVQAGPIDLATPAGRLVARQLGAVARYESEHRSARIARKHQELAEAGKPNGGRRPYGYTKDHKVEPAEAAILKECAQRLLAGESVRSVTRSLNDNEIPSASGGTWYTTTLRDMLVNPRAAGMRQYKGKIIGRGTWEPILDEDTWNALRTLLLDPSRNKTTTTARKHLLTALARCGVCERSVISGGISGWGDERRRYATYRCITRTHFVRKMSEIDKQVEALVVARLSQPDALALSSEPDRRNDAVRLAQQIEAVQKRLEGEAIRYAEDDSMTAPEYKAIVGRLRERLNDFMQKQARLQAPDRAVLKGLVGRPNVEEVWNNLELSRKRAVIDLLMSVYIHPCGRGGRYFRPETLEIRWRHE
jgi:DNA invertase Pin-like site-specific DNA recombinase